MACAIVIEDYDPIGLALEEVYAETRRAQELFPRESASAHEAFAIFKEEVDELWEEVRGKSDGDQTERKRRMRKEAVQAAAMAIRFIMEVCK